ncbi:WD40-repeat-containing domain protein [Microdochium bolleyi]|uniref:WD40-repeat-containing domain protein n=1 Tax=Microdochium bolleyi TaxID=196109 RepID=A0A136JIN4_9PEZI|nr:WD40-repeat-containing domain protein [Microdochium bolleyi]
MGSSGDRDHGTNNHNKTSSSDNRKVATPITSTEGKSRSSRHAAIIAGDDQPPKRRKVEVLSNGLTTGHPPTSITQKQAGPVKNYVVDQFKSDPRYLDAILKDVHERFADYDDPPVSLLARKRGFGALRQYQDFHTVFKNEAEDYLEPRMEFTNCAGDVVTISWLSNNEFICGATTHSDSRNQQYNKPGNLTLGNVMKKQLVAYPDHRIVRPVVTQGDNALESMRYSQDPWLFTSVVSSDYSVTHGLAFTSSFDHTVKIWRCQDGTMESVGTWSHGGRVNFVVASPGELGLVATAADVTYKTVRVYNLKEASQSPTASHLYSGARYDEYSCSCVNAPDFVPSDKWALFPAAISWGIAPQAQHLLLVGYAPRAHSGNDQDIPEEKQNSGELCVFDTRLRQPVKVIGGQMKNVFDVIWHPTQLIFAAATSTAPGLDVRKSDNVRTQVRLFAINKEGDFTSMKTLDCPASDINMLTISPNSRIFSYVTASCTDSRVYVWDSNNEDDRPMCVLKHGDPIDEIVGDRETEDVGVTFTAWGTTNDRLYTGSSDGVVKVWNIRHRRGKAKLIKDLIELQGPITSGAFSRDLSRLAIGDATGKVCIMTLEDDDEETVDLPGLRLDVGGIKRSIRRPRTIIPHPEVPAPVDPMVQAPEPEDGPSIGAKWLHGGELVSRPGLGVFQGPNYANIGLYRKDLHLDQDPNSPLLAQCQANQQVDRKPPLSHVRRQLPVPTTSTDRQDFAASNTSQVHKELAHLHLDATTEAQLKAERAEYDPSRVDYVFPYEDESCTFSHESSEDESMETFGDEVCHETDQKALDTSESDEDSSDDDNDDEGDESSDEDMTIQK